MERIGIRSNEKSNVLILKTKWQNNDEKRLIALQRHLDRILVPYPPCALFEELLAYVSQTWVLEVIVERWKIGVIANIMRDDYETVY
jgi:hypothetical protein